MDNIKKLKSKNNNQVKGAFFEILIAAMLTEGENQSLIIPKTGTSGYDLTLKFKDSSKIDISCKNHGISKHEKTFKEKCLEFEEKFIEVCNKLNIKKILCRVYIKEYPGPEDWNLLNNWIEYITNKTKKEGLTPQFKAYHLNKWDIGLSSNASDNFKFNLFIRSPFHIREMQNLRTNLDDDCFNLSKHGERQDQDNINILCIHLHPTASLDLCEQWIHDYFAEFDDKPISGILFLQPRLEIEHQENGFVLVCGYRLVKNRFYEKWENEKREIHMHFSIMRYFSEEDATIKFGNDTFEELNSGIDTKEFYIFQKVNYEIAKGGLMLPFQEFLLI